jgi:DNA-binding PadR family transcriptional regulator
MQTDGGVGHRLLEAQDQGEIEHTGGWVSAKHAVLGLLLERPAYQYELRDRLQQRLGPAWGVNTGQLSRITADLERDELIVPVDTVAGPDPRRRVFEISDKGIEELESWLDEKVEGVKLPRRPLLAKLTLGGRRRLEADALAKIDAYEKNCVRVRAELSRLLTEIPPDGPLVRADHLLLRVSVGADVAHVDGELAWARQARQHVSWLLANDALWPSKRRGDV